MCMVDQDIRVQVSTAGGTNGLASFIALNIASQQLVQRSNFPQLRFVKDIFGILLYHSSNSMYMRVHTSIENNSGAEKQ